MTLQILKYFVAVAHYRSYTRAAQACYITQPALSRAIVSMEKELGCKLFDRNTKQVSLTPAGEVCLQDAQEILAKCEQLKLHVRGAEHVQHHLNVGCTYVGYLPSLNRRLEESGQLFQMDTEYGNVTQLKRKLLDGKLDAILLPRVSCEGTPGLCYTFVERSRLCVLLHSGHPLAGRSEVSIRELHGQKFIAWDEKELPGVNQAHSAACQERGFTPHYIAAGKKLGDVMMLAQRHGALALTSKNIIEALPREFEVIPIQGSPEQYGLACAWREDDRSPAILCLEQMLRQGGAQTGDLLLESINEEKDHAEPAIL